MESFGYSGRYFVAMDRQNISNQKTSEDKINGEEDLMKGFILAGADGTLLYP